jgi:SAM-dependent methyltransferase
MSLRRALPGFALAVVAWAQQPALDVPYVPSSDEAVAAMLKLARVHRSDVVYDLGCGDGRIVIAAAKVYGARGVGIDLDPERIAEARLNAKNAGVDNLVRFEEADLFKADIRQATVVALFLMSRINQRLAPKLRHDLRPGARIVSNTFSMGGWEADQQFIVGGSADPLEFSKHLYLWIVPRRR